MEELNEDKLFKQCRDYWKEHEIILRTMFGMDSFDEYFATIKRQFNIYASLPDYEQKKFRDVHMMQVEKRAREISRASRRAMEGKK